MQACMSTRPPSAAGTASGAAGAAARSTTSPHRSTATPRAARTSSGCAPSCAGSSDSSRRDGRPARLARLRLRPHRHPGRHDDPRMEASSPRPRMPSRAASTHSGARRAGGRACWPSRSSLRVRADDAGSRATRDSRASRRVVEPRSGRSRDRTDGCGLRACGCCARSCPPAKHGAPGGPSSPALTGRFASPDGPALDGRARRARARP